MLQKHNNCFSNPTPDVADPGKKWTPAWLGEGMDFMELGVDFCMCREPINERVLFWDALYSKFMGRSLAS